MVKRFPWTPATFSVQPACLIIVSRMFSTFQLIFKVLSCRKLWKFQANRLTFCHRFERLTESLKQELGGKLLLWILASLVYSLKFHYQLLCNLVVLGVHVHLKKCEVLNHVSQHLTKEIWTHMSVSFPVSNAHSFTCVCLFGQINIYLFIYLFPLKWNTSTRII